MLPFGMIAKVIFESTFSICRIDIFYLAGTHVYMNPYLVANIAISNVEKIKNYGYIFISS